MTVSSKPTSSPLSRGCGAARAGVGARVVYVWECDAASRRRERSAGDVAVGVADAVAVELELCSTVGSSGRQAGVYSSR